MSRLRILNIGGPSLRLSVATLIQFKDAHSHYKGFPGSSGALEQKENGTAVSWRKSPATLIPLIQHSLEEVLRITMDLRPTALDDVGIRETIPRLYREYNKIMYIDLYQEGKPGGGTDGSLTGKEG